MIDDSGIFDEVILGVGKGMTDHAGITGYVVIEKRNADGELTGYFEGKNLVTQVGDQYYGERAAGIASPPAQVTGMRLGTGGTAVAKTGAGAALVTYLTGSNKALDGGYPTSSLDGSNRRAITWRRTYAAGEATTASAITEAVLVNDTIATDATSSAANTISRVLVTGVGSKGASDTLTVTWIHALLGA